MRNVLLAELCDHQFIARFSAAAASDSARGTSSGIKISGESCRIISRSTDDAVQNFDTNFKMNPPARERGRGCIARGIATGTLGILASDHRRTQSSKKEVSSTPPPSGSGPETELDVSRSARSQSKSITFRD